MQTTRPNSTARSYADILAGVVAKRLRTTGATSKAARSKPLDEPLRNSSVDNLGGFTPEAHALASQCIAKAGGLVRAVASIKTQRDHQRSGEFYTWTMSKADAATPPMLPAQMLKPKPITDAQHAQRQSHAQEAIDPADVPATQAHAARRTRDQHDALLDQIKQIHAAAPGKHPAGAA